MKSKFLKLLGAISAFFLSIFGLTACNNHAQALYGIPPSTYQDLYEAPDQTQAVEKEEIEHEGTESKNLDFSDPSSDI